MKSLLILAFEAIAVFGCHYLFIGVLRSQIYVLLMIVSIFVFAVTCICKYLESLFTSHNRPMKTGNICAIYFFVTIIFIFTNIGVYDKTKLFTVQMTYPDGYTETKTYELPYDAEFYLSDGSRYDYGTDLEYRSYPYNGGLIENNIIRYKVISVKDK